MWRRAAFLALALVGSALAAEAIVLTISAVVEGEAPPPTPADTVIRASAPDCSPTVASSTPRAARSSTAIPRSAACS